MHTGNTQDRAHTRCFYSNLRFKIRKFVDISTRSAARREFYTQTRTSSPRYPSYLPGYPVRPCVPADGVLRRHWSYSQGRPRRRSGCWRPFLPSSSPDRSRRGRPTKHRSTAARGRPRPPIKPPLRCGILKQSNPVKATQDDGHVVLDYAFRRS